MGVPDGFCGIHRRGPGRYSDRVSAGRPPHETADSQGQFRGVRSVWYPAVMLQLAVIAITKWSIQAPSSKKALPRRGCHLTEERKPRSLVDRASDHAATREGSCVPERKTPPKRGKDSSWKEYQDEDTASDTQIATVLRLELPSESSRVTPRGTQIPASSPGLTAGAFSLLALREATPPDGLWR